MYACTKMSKKHNILTISALEVYRGGVFRRIRSSNSA